MEHALCKLFWFSPPECLWQIVMLSPYQQQEESLQSLLLQEFPSPFTYFLSTLQLSDSPIKLNYQKGEKRGMIG